MFAPSFVTPHLIGWMGKTGLTILGLALMGAASLLAIEGIDLINFWGSLVLLGIGWNFGFLGATAMLADLCRPEERTRVQALNDLLVFGSVALASFGSGHMLASVGWEAINVLMLAVLVIVTVTLSWAAYRRRHGGPTTSSNLDN